MHNEISKIKRLSDRDCMSLVPGNRLFLQTEEWDHLVPTPLNCREDKVHAIQMDEAV